jgi:hypothetical protein
MSHTAYAHEMPVAEQSVAKVKYDGALVFDQMMETAIRERRDL